MRASRLLLACLTAASLAAPLASPAAAQEEADCPPDWVGVFLTALRPPDPSVQAIELDGETLTIRGDNVVAAGAGLAGYYVSTTETFLSCLRQHVTDNATPYRDCVAERSEPVLTSPDPVGRYVEAGTDLVVKVHYAQAVADVVSIFNCNGIVTYGDPSA